MAQQKHIDLKDELDTDPLTRGYAGMTDAEVRDSINAADRTVDRETMSGSEIFEAIDVTEWSGRTADQKDDIKFVVSLGDQIQIASGTKARDMLQNALSGATNSIANLGSISTKAVSRAEELGLGFVKIGDVQKARAL